MSGWRRGNRYVRRSGARRRCPSSVGRHHGDTPRDRPHQTIRHYPLFARDVRPQLPATNSYFLQLYNKAKTRPSRFPGSADTGPPHTNADLPLSTANVGAEYKKPSTASVREPRFRPSSFPDPVLPSDGSAPPPSTNADLEQQHHCRNVIPNPASIRGPEASPFKFSQYISKRWLGVASC